MITSLIVLGELVANRRTELGLNQSYTAELAGISRRTLQQIEKGKANPTINSILELLQVLGLQLTIDKRTTDEKKKR